jgi:pimeloyl-ACP methyl ester carboxylesterase
MSGSDGDPAETVSARWIATALLIVVAGSALCVWGVLCFTFWQGSWQLLYHPASVIEKTPADVGLAFDSVDFETSESGQPQLHGWWIPAGPNSRFTAIYLHGANGNIGDVVPSLARLHAAKLNLLVFDYRGYGMSQFQRPSETRWREDAESALKYLTDTRHIPAGSIVLIGSGLGANLALEVGAARADLLGVVVENPLAAPEDAVFNDPRARLVPAHALVQDRWDLLASARGLRIPLLWLEAANSAAQGKALEADYEEVGARKMRALVSESPEETNNYREALAGWLDDLTPNAKGS